MKNLKKVLALVLAFACAFTMFAGAAFTDEADIQAKDAVNMLTSLGVIEGYEDGSFNPDGTVTRAEMAKMIFVVRNNTADDAAYADVTTNLTDINGHWAEGYVKFCESQGIIAGYGDGTFRPDEIVTGTEAAKMLLVLTGYDEVNAGLTGTAWATNTLRHAGAAGILDSVSASLSAGLPRQWAAQMIANTLSADRVVWSSDSQSFDTVLNGGIKETVGRAYMGLYNSIGTLVRIDMDRLNITQSTADENESDPIDTIWDGSKLKGDYATEFTKVGTDYSDLLGQKVRVMFKNGHTNEVLGVFPVEGNTVYTVAANQTSKSNDRVSFGGNSYRLDDGNTIKTYVDGQRETATSLDDLDHNALNPNMYTFIDSDDNGRLDTLVVRTYEVAQVTYSDSSKIIANGYTYEYDDDNIADDIANGDWIVITRNLFNDNNDIVKAEVQTATLDALRDNKEGTIYFDSPRGEIGTEVYNQYQIGDNWYNGAEDVLQSAVSENDLNAVKAGESVDYVAVNGIMFYVKRTAGEANGRVDNVALVVRLDDTGVADRARLQLFNGDEITVDVSDRGEVKYGDLKEGVVYEYSVSGGQYRFAPLKEGVSDANKKFEEYYGDLTYRGDLIEANADDAANDTYKANVAKMESIDGKVIDDNAQIILFSAQVDGGNNITGIETATMTGKQYKALTLNNTSIAGGNLAQAGYANSPITGDITGNIVAYAFSGNMSGLDRVGALAIQVSNNVILSNLDYNTWTNYGFIINDAKFVDGSGRKIITYDILTESGVITVQEDRTTLADRDKNTLIGFNDMETKDDVTTIDEVDQLHYNGGVDDHVGGWTDKLFFDAIDTIAKNGDMFTTHTGDDIDISSAIKLFVNTKDGEAVLENGVIKDATADRDGNYMANVIYLLDESGDAAVAIFEQTDYLRSDFYKTDLAGQNLGNQVDGDASHSVIYGGNANAAGINAPTASGNTITEGEALNAVFTFTVKNIANGTQPTINAADLAALNTAGMSATVSAVSNSQFTVTVTGNPTAGAYTADVEIGDAKQSFTITVNENTNGVEYDSTNDIVRALMNAEDGVPVIVGGVIPSGNMSVPANKVLQLNGYVSGAMTIGGDGKVTIGDNFMIDSGTTMSVNNLEVVDALPADGNWTINNTITATADSVTAANAAAMVVKANTTVKAVTGDVPVNAAGKTLTVSGNVTGKVVLTNGSVVVEGVITDLANTTSAATKSLTMKGDISEAVTLNAGLLGTTTFEGTVSAVVTMPASGALDVTFAGTVDTDNVMYDATNNSAVVKFTGDGITLGDTVVYGNSSSTKITDVADIVGATDGFTYNATADGTNPGWKAN